MLRYQSVFYTIDLPVNLQDLSEELTPLAVDLDAIAQELADYLGPNNPDALLAFPDYTFPQVVEMSKNPMLIASLDPQTQAAQMGMPLEKLLEMNTSMANDLPKLITPTEGGLNPPKWPLDQLSADSLFKLFKNPPANFGSDSSVKNFLAGLADKKSKYTEQASKIRGGLDKLKALQAKLPNLDKGNPQGMLKLPACNIGSITAGLPTLPGVPALPKLPTLPGFGGPSALPALPTLPTANLGSIDKMVKLNLSTNILSMQKMGLNLRDSHLSGLTFGGFKL